MPTYAKLYKGSKLLQSHGSPGNKHIRKTSPIRIASILCLVPRPSSAGGGNGLGMNWE